MHFLKGFLQTCILFAIVAASSTAQTLTISASAPWQNSPYYTNGTTSLQNGDFWLIKGDGVLRIQTGSLHLFGTARIEIEDGGELILEGDYSQLVLHDNSIITKDNNSNVNTGVISAEGSNTWVSLMDASTIQEIAQIIIPDGGIAVYGDNSFIGNPGEPKTTVITISELYSWVPRPLQGEIELYPASNHYLKFNNTGWEIGLSDEITMLYSWDIDMTGHEIVVAGDFSALFPSSMYFNSATIHVSGIFYISPFLPIPGQVRFRQDIIGTPGSEILFNASSSLGNQIVFEQDARIETEGLFWAEEVRLGPAVPGEEWKGIFVHGSESRILMEHCEVKGIQYPYSGIELLDSPNPENSVTYCTISNEPGTLSYQSSHGVKVQYTQRPNFSYLYMCHNMISGFDNGVFNYGSAVDMDCSRLTDNLIGYNCVKGIGHYNYNAIYDNVNVGMRFSGFSGFFQYDRNNMILNEVTNNPLNVELRDGCNVWASRNNLQAVSPNFAVLAGTSSFGLFERNYYGNPMPPFIIIVEPGAYFSNTPTIFPYNINPDVTACHPDLLGGGEGGGDDGGGDGTGKLAVMQIQKNAISNYPNPFNPSTVINYTLDEETFVKLTVYNALGEQIATLVDEVQGNGTHSATFTADQSLPSGTYLYTLTTSAGVHRGTMMLTK